jgi:hypothetical protein
MTWTEKLEQNQSERALVGGIQGGFFLMKNLFGGLAPGYSYSGFAITGGELQGCHVFVKESKIAYRVY